MRRCLLALTALASGLGSLPGGATPAGVALETLVSGLDRPLAITHAGDGSGRLFIVQQTGQILIHDGVQLLPTPFLDLGSLVSCCGERGLLSVAFHPQYASNGLFYVSYTDPAGDSVIARYAVSGDPDVADAASGATLLSVAQPFPNHNNGQLQFGLDGYLYIGMGDGGSGGDPGNRAQDPGQLLGKLLRIDVDGGTPYAIPASNPFVGDPDTLDEIWALGLRNPWRFSFDRLTGDLFIGDVGQASWEEVDFEAAASGGGSNYGWRRMEGSSCFDPPSGCNDGTLTLPILEYDHSQGCSITGGYRYRGVAHPQFSGTYFYGDFCSGRIWGASQSGGVWNTTELLDSPIAISAFGEDEAGELYVAHLASGTGAVHRLVPPACDDGVDNDGDGDVDHPDDPGCASAASGLEGPQCDDDKRRRCGLGFEPIPLLAVLLGRRGRRRHGPKASAPAPG